MAFSGFSLFSVVFSGFFGICLTLCACFLGWTYTGCFLIEQPESILLPSVLLSESVEIEMEKSSVSCLFLLKIYSLE